MKKLPDSIKKALEDYKHWYSPFVQRNPNHGLGHWMGQNWRHAIEHGVFPSGAQMPKGVQREIREAFLSSFEPKALEAKVIEFLTTTPERTLSAIASLRENRQGMNDRKTLERIWELCENSSLETVLLQEIEWLRGCIEKYHEELNPDNKTPLYVSSVPKFQQELSSGWFYVEETSE